MADWRVIRNAATGQVVLERAKWCQNFWCHFRGLMLRRNLPESEGLLFAFGRENRSDASIHMFFMFFAIAAVWLDNDGRVVDAKLARPWRPYYVPAKPARYLIEAQPSLLERVVVGEQLAFDEVLPS
ncbi:MAG TPA: DUF192 domain-containing protein [Aggregatilineaceae bacterium]|nr:DUF192 domain-containing protein [Aggregatilineaceae bacterium]